MRPITPQEAMARRRDTIPPEVFDAFNELILENLDSAGVSTFRLDEVRERVVSKLPSNSVLKGSWFDVEDEYRRAGWDVDYDSPGYNETYPATFTFTHGRNVRGPVRGRCCGD